VNESEPSSLPLPSVALPEVVSAPVEAPRLPRWLALLQVIAVCGIPTQIGIAIVLMLAFGMSMTIDSGPSLSFFTIVSMIDTVVVVLLIRAFLAFNGERAAVVFIGTRPVAGEVVKGLLLVPVVFLLVAGLVLTLRAVAPWMQTVERNPLEAFITTPLDAGIFFVVAVLAGASVRNYSGRSSCTGSSTGWVAHRSGSCSSASRSECSISARVPMWRWPSGCSDWRGASSSFAGAPCCCPWPTTPDSTPSRSSRSPSSDRWDGRDEAGAILVGRAGFPPFPDPALSAVAAGRDAAPQCVR
jgi:hypothetical protein